MRGESADRKKRSRTRKAIFSRCETGGSSRSADGDQSQSSVREAPSSVEAASPKTTSAKITRAKTTGAKTASFKSLVAETRCQAGHRGDQDAHDTAAAETALPEAHAVRGAAR
jgi:hypothetical protein